MKKIFASTNFLHDIPIASRFWLAKGNLTLCIDLRATTSVCRFFVASAREEEHRRHPAAPRTDEVQNGRDEKNRRQAPEHRSVDRQSGQASTEEMQNQLLFWREVRERTIKKLSSLATQDLYTIFKRLVDVSRHSGGYT